MCKLRFRLSTAVFVLPALALTLVLLACADGSAAGGVMLGSKPDFRLQTMDGRVIGPVDFPGKVVVVDFWATWCQPCKIQSMILDSVVKGMSDKPVVFLSADVGETKETVRSFMKDNPHVGIPVLLDPESKVSDALGVQGLPTLMVVDRKGRVMVFHTGLTDGPTLQHIIQQASL
jgi:cytochrome c biogenesis protein CcmG/thiol:disulfide interchange protein DsbE